jgi:hypothetical protein
MSGRGGPTDRSAGLLEGQACLSGTAETLVGEDPGVLMSLKPPDRCVGVVAEMRSCRSEVKA